MKRIEERLAAGEILVCDGAMGTLLQARGLQPGECPERWCLDRPDDVRAIHRAYHEAGSDIVECNSFGASRPKLTHFGLESRVAEINRAAASLAREIAGADGHVLGSIGPTGEFMEPYGTATEAELLEVFAEQALALEQGGADAVIVETMTAIEECCTAIRAVREHTALTVVASFTFDPQQQGGYASMMGVRPAPYAQQAAEAGAMIVGTNCGTGPAHMLEVVKLLRAATDLPLMAMPNAGMPVVEDGRTVFKETPEQMAEAAKELVAAGAAIIGGCCGTGPEHIAAMKRAIQQ